MGAQSERNLARIATLKPQIAEVHAARLGSDFALVQERHCDPASPEKIGGPAADEAAADNCYIGPQMAHGLPARGSSER
jgi:hypothetical protein